MSVRITLLFLSVTVLSVCAFKDWFKSLCGLILMMAVIEHEDMPKTIFGVQGLNMWNLLFAVIFIAWLISRRKEGLKWDMPGYINVLLLMYLGVVIIGVFRAIFDRSYIEDYSIGSLISEELINTIKWVLPGVLIFDGCRTRNRVIMVLVCLLIMYFLISLQVIKRMPFESALGGAGERIQYTRLKICKSIGFSSCDMSTMLAGASWGMLAILPLVRKKKYWLMILVISGVIAFAQALTGGRAGYMAWGATGLMLCFVKWRKYLVLVPVAVMLLPVILPGATARMLEGFGQIDAAGQNITNNYELTSGRTLIWPYVIDKIGESPMIGYGRLAMNRTGLTEYISNQYGESFPHAHNMYLETLLDNGIIGSIPILLYFVMIIIYSGLLFRADNKLCSAVGGLTLSLVSAQMFAGISAQHFYPRESTLCMWVAMFLVIRVYIESKRTKQVPAINNNSLSRQLLQQQKLAVPTVNV